MLACKVIWVPFSLMHSLVKYSFSFLLLNMLDSTTVRNSACLISCMIQLLSGILPVFLILALSVHSAPFFLSLFSFLFLVLFRTEMTRDAKSEFYVYLLSS